MAINEDISEVIDSIRDLCGVGICYYDLNSFFNYDRYGVKNNRGHYCAFCARAKGLPCGQASCDKSDRSEAVMLAEQYREPFFFECHMGMRELIVPLRRGEELIGILFVGQCRVEGEQAMKNVRQCARRMGGDPDEMVALYEQLPLLDTSALINVGNILSRYFHVKIVSNELISPAAASVAKGAAPALRIRNFINANYHHDLSAGSVAERMYLHPAYASRCFSRAYGMTITDYIHHVRIERARVLLRTTQLPVSSIAINVGFAEANYFSRVFKRLEGMTPQQYRTK